MDIALCIAKAAVFLLGLGLSIFYGLFAVYIFVPEDDLFVLTKTKYKSWWVHQFCFNFLGSAVGWAAAYYFTFCRLIPLTCYAFRTNDIALVVIALLGMSGFLPLTISLIPRTLGSLVSLVVKKD